LSCATSSLNAWPLRKPWRDASGRCQCGRPQNRRDGGGQYASTAQDLVRGKRSEIDHLNGFIVRRGEALSVATPANRLLHATVKLIESSSGSSLPSNRRLKLELNHGSVERTLS